MARSAPNMLKVFQWRPQPEAARLVDEILGQYCGRCPAAQRLCEALYRETGTRLMDWIDHVAVPAETDVEPRLRRAGFLPEGTGFRVVWRHAEGLFPEIEVHGEATWRAAIKVDSVDQWLAAQRIEGHGLVEGRPLALCDSLGTVGLWCRLHGEAFLQAGMHHLECRFDFHAARTQLGAAGIGQMEPFTNLPYLKQAFTRDEADRFRRSGAIGSHLEILERNEGYKGFNRAGINEIIRDTDPRRTESARR